ncbi:hypothetical protein ACFXGR_22770 [Streptomyces mirabilis]|uniref:hypothetical protein n=1 Tax=Streptomyces mirabilis TaxID=68239 RepID=UPI0036855D6D
MANPKLSTLNDQFGGATLNTVLWNASAASPNVQLDAVLDRVAVSCTTNYYALASTLWDATSVTGGVPNGVYARVVPTPVGNGSTQTFFEVLLDANNKATFAVSGGVFTAAVTNAGVATTTTIAASWAAYDPYVYAWWRITEAAGSFVFATSPDAYTWTTRATIAYTWNATATKFQFVTGYYASESAGMSAYIDHVNTTSSAPGQPNLNWPQIEDGWSAFWNANGGDSPLDRYVEVTDRTRGSVTVSRGRQYELDQVRAGEAGLTLANTDAALDPTNASGPWYGHIAPYQPYRRRAQWPPTRNLLDQVHATAGDLGGYSLGAIPGGSGGADLFFTDPSPSFVSSATAWQGSTVIQFSVASGLTSTTRVCHTPRWSVIPGQTYTVTLRVRDVTAATSLSVQAFFGWYTAGGGLVPTSFNYGTSAALTGSTTAGWTTITATATAPANAAGIDVGVALAATAAATATMQVDGWQLEKGSTSTTWVCPGVWNPVYAGYMERWPSSWNMSGTYGVVQPTAVDALSLLSQVKLSDPLTEEINSHSPRFLYVLGDPAGSTSVTDATGVNPAAPLAISKYGAGSLVFGNQITAANTTTGIYSGSSNTVATVNNPNPGVNVTGAATFISLNKAGITGPAQPSGAWTRMIAFRYTAGSNPTNGAYIWSAFDGTRSGGTPSGSIFGLLISTSGQLQLILQGPTGTGSSFLPSGSVADSNWHLAIISYSHATATLAISLDGSTSFWGSFNPNLEPTTLISDNVGAYVDTTVGYGTILNFKGDLSFAAEFPSALSSTDMSNLYAAWKAACAGESTSARYARILRYAGYTGPSAVQTGLTASMGAANIDGQDAVSALQAVVDTEGGEHFVDRQGFVQFKARSARYNALTPIYTFGENPGEWPYEDVTLDYDSTHLSNQVTVTQEGTSQVFYAQDATSSANYFQRTLTRTINSSSALECQDAANYLLSRYKNPATRVSAIKLHPSANPALWPVCLALELGTRVRVMRRPPGVPATQIECFVENIVWDFGDDGEAFQTLQCSPADLTPYGVFSSWHTTLKNAITAGATSITINPSQDNTNVLAGQLAVGEVITLDPGTAASENVTVSAIGATSPGWTSAVITLTAGTVNAHGIGAVVCDQLPAGTTDPTTWDAVSMFDSTAFAY